jgi:hypothetical protein
VVQFLLVAKANREMKNRSGETAADLARKRGYDEIVKVLEGK